MLKISRSEGKVTLECDDPSELANFFKSVPESDYSLSKWSAVSLSKQKLIVMDFYMDTTKSRQFLRSWLEHLATSGTGKRRKKAPERSNIDQVWEQGCFTEDQIGKIESLAKFIKKWVWNRYSEEDHQSRRDLVVRKVEELFADEPGIVVEVDNSKTRNFMPGGTYRMGEQVYYLNNNVSFIRYAPNSRKQEGPFVVRIYKKTMFKDLVHESPKGSIVSRYGDVLNLLGEAVKIYVGARGPDDRKETLHPFLSILKDTVPELEVTMDETAELLCGANNLFRKGSLNRAKVGSVILSCDSSTALVSLGKVRRGDKELTVLRSKHGHAIHRIGTLVLKVSVKNQGASN